MSLKGPLPCLHPSQIWLYFSEQWKWRRKKIALRKLISQYTCIFTGSVQRSDFFGLSYIDSIWNRLQRPHEKGHCFPGWQVTGRALVRLRIAMTLSTSPFLYPSIILRHFPLNSAEKILSPSLEDPWVCVCTSVSSGHMRILWERFYSMRGTIFWEKDWDYTREFRVYGRGQV